MLSELMEVQQPQRPLPPTSVYQTRYGLNHTDLRRSLLDYLAALVDKRMEKPQDDVISKLVVEQLRNGHIEKSDAVQIAFLLLVAGNATMVNMISLVSSWRCAMLKSLLTSPGRCEPHATSQAIGRTYCQPIPCP